MGRCSSVRMASQRSYLGCLMTASRRIERSVPSPFKRRGTTKIMSVTGLPTIHVWHLRGSNGRHVDATGHRARAPTGLAFLFYGEPLALAAEQKFNDVVIGNDAVGAQQFRGPNARFRNGLFGCFTFNVQSWNCGAGCGPMAFSGVRHLDLESAVFAAVCQARCFAHALGSFHTPYNGFIT